MVSGSDGADSSTLTGVKSAGKVPHEMVIGTMDERKEHAEMMRKMPGMQAEPNMITLGPGQRGGIFWQFDKAGAVNFACLVPGHMEWKPACGANRSRMTRQPMGRHGRYTLFVAER